MAGAIDVGADLAEQVVEPGKRPAGAEALEDIEFDGATVEVAIEVEEVGFDRARRSPKVTFGPM